MIDQIAHNRSTAPTVNIHITLNSQSKIIILLVTACLKLSLPLLPRQLNRDLVPINPSIINRKMRLRTTNCLIHITTATRAIESIIIIISHIIINHIIPTDPRPTLRVPLQALHRPRRRRRKTEDNDRREPRLETIIVNSILERQRETIAIIRVIITNSSSSSIETKDTLPRIAMSDITRRLVSREMPIVAHALPRRRGSRADREKTVIPIRQARILVDPHRIQTRPNSRRPKMTEARESALRVNRDRMLAEAIITRAARDDRLEMRGRLEKARKTARKMACITRRCRRKRKNPSC